MLSLVSYDSSDDSNSGSSSSSDSSDNEAEEKTIISNKNPLIKPALPSAIELLTSSSKSSKNVLGNPYKEAEDAKIASLEKHVKMVDNDEKVAFKNGKKICWNFRKGRCRFGSKCSYAHDSDIQGMSSSPPEESATDAGAEEQLNIKPQKDKKKRPGLGDSLIPSKKVLTNYGSLK